MKTIKNIKLTNNNLEIDYLNSSLKLNYYKKENELFVDITNFNLLKAVEVAILCSTHFFIKGINYKLVWLVKDIEIKNAISILCLKNCSCFVDDSYALQKVYA